MRAPRTFVIAVACCFRRNPHRPVSAIPGEQDAHENQAIRQFVAGARATRGTCGLIESFSMAVRTNWGSHEPPRGTESARSATGFRTESDFAQVVVQACRQRRADGTPVPQLTTPLGFDETCARRF